MIPSCSQQADIISVLSGHSHNRSNFRGLVAAADIRPIIEPDKTRSSKGSYSLTNLMERERSSFQQPNLALSADIEAENRSANACIEHVVLYESQSNPDVLLKNGTCTS